MDELTEHISQTAARAVEISDVMNLGRLDFSESSLSILEEMAEELSGGFEAMTPDQKEAASQCFGCYILEVAHREFGGQYAWFEDRNQPVLMVGEPVFQVALMTWDKALGRLSGDEADNLPFFYTGFAERVRSAEPGTNVLYV